jgi:hypothetical protein
MRSVCPWSLSAWRPLKWSAWACVWLLGLLLISAAVYCIGFEWQCRALKKRMLGYTPAECEALIQECRAYAARQDPQQHLIRIGSDEWPALPPALRTLKPQTISYSQHRITVTLRFLIDDGVSFRVFRENDQWILEGVFAGEDSPVRLHAMSAARIPESIPGK